MDIIQRFRKCRKYYGGGGLFYPIGKIIATAYTPSQSIIDYIKSAEGFKENWYKDSKGNLTIGYGFKHTPELAKAFPNGMTQQEADDYLVNVAIAERLPRLKALTPNWDILNQNQRDALLSAFYNIGEGTYSQGSPKLQAALRAKNWTEVANQMDWGYNDDKNPGLKARRDYERKLFLTPISNVVKRK